MPAPCLVNGCVELQVNLIASPENEQPQACPIIPADAALQAPGRESEVKRRCRAGIQPVRWQAQVACDVFRCFA